MNKLNTIQEIKDAINAGKRVFSNSGYYEVIKDSIGQYLIKSGNGHYVGLHGQEGTPYENKLNGKDFYTNT